MGLGFLDITHEGGPPPYQKLPQESRGYAGGKQTPGCLLSRSQQESSPSFPPPVDSGFLPCLVPLEKPSQLFSQEVLLQPRLLRRAGLRGDT